jgi:AcrR family transcriptional regulator
VTPRVLSRRENQERTRSALLDSAAKVFARRGFEGATLDEVAADAGYTKGAVYANFDNKEELFLAMLDERFAARLEELDSVMSSDEPPEEQARRAGGDFARYVAADPDWQRLFAEFTAHAARNDRLRRELVVRYKVLRARIAEGYRQRSEELGVEPPLPAEAMAQMTFAMANGFACEKLLEPDVSDELFGSMLAIFFAGLRALAEERDGALA